MTQCVNWVLDADIRKFFDSVDHEWLLRMCTGSPIRESCGWSARGSRLVFWRMESSARPQKGRPKAWASARCGPMSFYIMCWIWGSISTGGSGRREVE